MAKAARLLVACSTLLLWTCVSGEGGFCGLEPPKDGKSCSGTPSGLSKKATEKQIEDAVVEKLVYRDFPENETELW